MYKLYKYHEITLHSFLIRSAVAKEIKLNNIYNLQIKALGQKLININYHLT